MDFNNHVQNYSNQVQQAISVTSVKHEIFLAEKADQLINLSRQQFGDLGKVRVLDVGCGVGLLEDALIGNFKRLVGVDIAPEVIQRAKDRVHSAEFFLYDGFNLPFQDSEFDLVFACCVFHHIPPEHRLSIAQDMARVCSKGGLIVIFEHNPLNPATRLIVSRCEFDQDAVLLNSLESKKLLSQVGLKRIFCRQILYFPWRNRFFKLLEKFISWIPMGAQYVVYSTK